MSAVMIKENNKRGFGLRFRETALRQPDRSLFSPSSVNAANVTINALIIEDDGANVMVTRSLRKGKRRQFNRRLSVGRFCCRVAGRTVSLKKIKIEELLKRCLSVRTLLCPRRNPGRLPNRNDVRRRPKDGSRSKRRNVNARDRCPCILA